MRIALLSLLLALGCGEPTPEPTPVAASRTASAPGAALPPLPDDTPAPSVRASRQQVIDYLADLEPEELAAVLAEATAAPEPSSGSDRVQPVELDLPPRRPETDGLEPPDESSAPRRPETDGFEPLDEPRAPAAPVEPPEAPPPPVPPTNEPSPPPQPATPTRPQPQDDGAVKPDLSDPKVYACTSPGDCAITCAMDCCGAPCGCRTAVNKAFKPAIEKWGRRDCPSPRRCPAVGCAYEPAMAATCRDGRCQPLMGGLGF